MLIQALTMISMIYDWRCETFGFARRNSRFVFADFGPHRRRKRNERRSRRQETHEAAAMAVLRGVLRTVAQNSS
jgi:hypothetical protein